MPGGSQTNVSGLSFEKQVIDLLFQKEMNSGDLYTMNGKKFIFYSKKALHKYLVKQDMYNSNDWDHHKEPDFSLLDESNETLFLFEVKHQIDEGSCDNKIRGAESLRREYKEYLYPKLKHVYMCYILNRGQETPGTFAYGFGIKKLKIPIKHNEDDGIPFFFAEKTDNRYKLFKKKRKGKDDLWIPYPLQYKIDTNAIENWMISKLPSSTHPDSLNV
tara:strand:- start:1424 stop:2074 length:651 start_codon:yes stop_codon:yes gene_type:complete